MSILTATDVKAKAVLYWQIFSWKFLALGVELVKDSVTNWDVLIVEVAEFGPAD